MKLFIFSDTHDRLSKISAIIKEINQEKPDIIMHLGDFISPFFIEHIFNEVRKNMKSERIILIKGNNDGDIELIRSKCDKYNLEFYLEYFDEVINGKKIFSIHKPNLAEKLAKSNSYDYVFYGHTHQRMVKKVNSSILANPGTASGYLADESSYIILDLNNDKLELKLIK